MRDSVLKHWMRSGLGLVAGVAVVVGCGTKESTGPAADYTLSLAPAALTIVQGATGNTTVTITRTNFTDAVTLSLGGAKLVRVMVTVELPVAPWTIVRAAGAS